MGFLNRLSSVVYLTTVLLASVGCQTLPVAGNSTPKVPQQNTPEDPRRAALEAEAPAAFAAFDHFGGQSFFTTYPLTLDAPAFMAENWSGVVPRLQAADTNMLRAFALNYPALGPDESRALGALFLSAYLAEKGDRSLKTILAAHVEASRVGLHLANISSTKIGFIEVTSPTLLRDGQIDFPMQIEPDLPIEVSKANLEEAFPRGWGPTQIF